MTREVFLVEEKKANLEKAVNSNSPSFYNSVEVPQREPLLQLAYQIVSLGARRAFSEGEPDAVFLCDAHGKAQLCAATRSSVCLSRMNERQRRISYSLAKSLKECVGYVVEQWVERTELWTSLMLRTSLQMNELNSTAFCGVKYHPFFYAGGRKGFKKEQTKGKRSKSFKEFAMDSYCHTCELRFCTLIWYFTLHRERKKPKFLTAGYLLPCGLQEASVVTLQCDTP